MKLKGTCGQQAAGLTPHSCDHFTSLFRSLSAGGQDVQSPARPPLTHRSETEDGKRGKGRKRRGQGGHTAPHKKMRCHQAQTTYDATSFKDDDSKAKHYHMHNPDSEHARTGFTKEVMHDRSDKAGYGNACHKGQKYKTNNNRNVSKQQQQQHQQRGRGRPANRGGNHQTRGSSRRGGWDRRNKNDTQDLQVKRSKFMTQEFKDQNALLVDGRLLCRHFIWGRCIKGDDCQLEHIQGYNDLVKEVCKFYVQGFCTKGESCPYMHKSFPCKFFHRRGKCSQGADCKFSHEPLNDVTTQLLDEALKREKDLYELAKKAEEESSELPVVTEEPEITDETPDILTQPLRPNFYESADTNAEKEALSCQTEELADGMEAVPPHASDGAQPHTPPSTNLNRKEPVCYSVEAVLGPQLSKPFPNFFTTPGRQESFDRTSGSANQSEVPYSVDAVLRSCKSVENSTFGHTPPTAQTVSYRPKTYFEEISEPQSSEAQNEKFLYSLNARNEANKPQEKMFKSLLSPQAHTSPISKTCPRLTLASGDHKKHAGNLPESLKLAQSKDLKGGTHLPTGVTRSVNCKGEGVLPFGPTQRKSTFSRPPRQTSTSKHPAQLKPHPSFLASDSQASVKPLCPSSGFTEFKGRAEPVTTSSIKTSDSTNSVSRPIAAKPADIHLHSKKTQSGLKVGTRQRYSTENTAECRSNAAHCGDLAVGRKKTLSDPLKRPFHSLFASPITDALQPTDDSVTSSSCPRGLTQSSSPPQPDKASTRSFLSLFAAPLSAAPLPCMQSQLDSSRTSSRPLQSNRSVDNASNLSDSKQSASNLETAVLRKVTTDGEETLHVPRSPSLSPNPKTGNEDPSDSVSEMFAHRQEPDTSPRKRSAASQSVLKTLFVCLSPYQQDGEQQDSIQISLPSEGEQTDKSSAESDFVKQQKSNKKGRRKKELKTHDSPKQSAEKTVTQSTARQPSLQTPQISSEATGGSTVSSPGTTEPQVRNSGTHNLPFKPVAPLMHARPKLKHASEEGKRGNGNVAPTPLKDLFKTLDTTVFHLGH